MNEAVRKVLAHLPDAKQYGDEFKARCPAHDDNKASLSIGLGDNGGAVLRCFAGCTNAAIVAALGLTLADLMPPKEKERKGDEWEEVRGTRREGSRYNYLDGDGEMRYQAIRYSFQERNTTGQTRGSKDFRQRRPDSKGGFTWNLQGVERVLYRLPDVQDGVRDGCQIWIPEGEKDVENLFAAGFVATTNVGGASAPWLPAYTEALRGANVVILPDNDQAGRDHANKVAQALHGVATSIKMLALPDIPIKGDVSDWLAKGGTTEKLQQLADNLPEWTPPPQTQGDDALLRDLATLPEIPNVPKFGIPSARGRDAQGRAVYQGWQIVEILAARPGYTWDVAAPDTHAAHAYRLSLLMGDNLCYCPQLGWLFWNGKFWERDDKENTATIGRAAALSRVVRDEAAYLFGAAQALAKEGREEDAKAASKAANDLLRHAGKVEQLPFLQGTLALAADRLRVAWRVFQPKPWVIGFDNGTWEKGTFREHRRDDYMLSVSAVSYLPDACADEWNAVLDRMTGRDAKLARTLQEIAGYCFSGASHLRVIPWAYGPKGTGKSTYAELIKTVLSSEAVAVDNEYLTGGHSRERLGALLFGKRFAMNAEAGEQRMNAEALKQLSGADTLPVRFLFKEAFDAPPRHVLLMVANDPPVLTAYDDALKSRVKVLPLIHSLSEPQPLKLTGGARIEAVRQDPQSPLAIGFTAWAVEGLAAVYRTQDVYLAPVVLEASAKFWQDTDPLTGFWETVESRELEEGYGIPKPELRKRYETWCEQEGVRRPMPPRQWAKACEVQGLQEYRVQGTRYWSREPSKSGATSATSAANSQSFLRENNAPRVNLSENAALVALVAPTPTPADLKTVTNDMVKAVKQAAQTGLLSDTGYSPVPLADDRQAEKPRAYFLSLVEEANRLRTEQGDDWNKAGEGKRINGDVLAFAWWWEQRRAAQKTPDELMSEDE